MAAPKPPKIPKIPPWAILYTTAWAALKDDRSLGNGGSMTRIYYASISRYGHDLGLSGDHLRRLVYFVKELDEEYLAHIRSKLEKEGEQKK